MSRPYYVNEGLKVRPRSKEFKDGYESKKGGCWWRGCPYCHDTQAFRDWLAGWQKAHDEED